jgi:hypothetical protein
MVLFPLNFFSQKRYLPKFTPSTVSGLLAGISIGGKNGGMTKGYGVCTGASSLGWVQVTKTVTIPRNKKMAQTDFIIQK